MFSQWLLAGLVAICFQNRAFPAGQESGVPIVNSLQQFPDPKIELNDSKYPNFESDDDEAKERAKDYFAKFAREYLRIWSESENGRGHPLDVEPLIASTLDAITRSNRMSLIRGLNTVRLKSALDTLALRALFRDPLRPQINFDESKYPRSKVGLVEARRRASDYSNAYVAAAGYEWESTRGAPFPFPASEIIRSLAKKAILMETNFEKLNGVNPGGVADLVVEASLDVDRNGAIEMGNYFLRRLERMGFHDVDGDDRKMKALGSEIERLESSAKGGSQDLSSLVKSLSDELGNLEKDVRNLTVKIMVALSIIIGLGNYIFLLVRRS